MKPKNIDKDYSAFIQADVDFHILWQNPKFRDFIDLLKDEEILLIGTTRDVLVVKHHRPADGWDRAKNELDPKYKEFGWDSIIDYGHQRYYWNSKQYDKIRQNRTICSHTLYLEGYCVECGKKEGLEQYKFQIYCDKCGKTDNCYKYNGKFLCVKCK